jgi:hypothetical protein
LGSMAAVAEPMNSCIEPQLPSIHGVDVFVYLSPVSRLTCRTVLTSSLAWKAIRPPSVTNEPINLRLKEFPAAEINFNNQPRMS